jgi:hypothetical protein
MSTQPRAKSHGGKFLLIVAVGIVILVAYLSSAHHAAQVNNPGGGNLYGWLVGANVHDSIMYSVTGS